MPTKKQLEDQVRALSADQKTMVLDEARPWSDKREEYDNRDKDIKELLAQHAALTAVEGDPFGAVAGADGGSAPAAGQAFASLGDEVIASNAYQSVKDRKGDRFSAGLDIKGLRDAIITEAGGGIGGVVPTYLPGVQVPTLFRRLTVADLLPQGAMSSASLVYVQETAVTNAAAAVAEGNSKPQSDITLAQVTEVARKIANTSKISDEMLNDVPYIHSYVNGRLVLFLQLAEEDQLLNGSGTAPNLRGILNRSGLAAAQALAADTRPDAIFKEMTKIRTGAFLEPDGIVINPTDWQTIRLGKDTNQQYYGGGPFAFSSYGNKNVSPGDTTNLAGGADQLWGVPVVVTPAITQGTALVGAFGTAAQMFRRDGIRVEFTNSNEDDFLKNLIAIRVEERIALAVYRPGAFGTVTGL